MSKLPAAISSKQMDLEIDINTDITISSKNTRSKHARGGTHLSGADHSMSME